MQGPLISFDHAVHECTAHDLAHPAVVVVPGQTALGQPVFLCKTLGGLTKLEAGALRIAAAAIVGHLGTVSHAPEELALIAADLAAATLAECRRRQQEQEREVVAAREAAVNGNGDGQGQDDVGRGRILTP